MQHQLVFLATRAPLVNWNYWSTRPFTGRFHLFPTELLNKSHPGELHAKEWHCQQAGSQLPTLYICPVGNVLGSVQLMPCNLKGNHHNTVQHSFQHKLELLLIPDQTAGQEAGYWRSTSGCCTIGRCSQKDLSGGCPVDALEACSRVKPSKGTREQKLWSTGTCCSCKRGCWMNRSILCGI